MDIKRNMFSLEGIDGVGKTTQAPLIKDVLESYGFAAHLLKSPDTTLLGEFIRANVRHLDPWVRNQLFLLDIQATLRRFRYEADVVLIWDRYIDSFYASNPEMTLDEAEELVRPLARPYRTFWLDIDPSVIFDRRKQSLDHHSDPIWLQLKVDRYRQLYALHPSRIIRIDADRPKASVTEQITNTIMDSYKNEK